MIISGGKFVPGLGGGVCQVSSTLYNAVLLADLEVIERHPHSLQIDYVPREKMLLLVMVLRISSLKITLPEFYYWIMK